jgi:hypothetical protein
MNLLIDIDSLQAREKEMTPQMRIPLPRSTQQPSIIKCPKIEQPRFGKLDIQKA